MLTYFVKAIGFHHTNTIGGHLNFETRFYRMIKNFIARRKWYKVNIFIVGGDFQKKRVGYIGISLFSVGVR